MERHPEYSPPPFTVESQVPAEPPRPSRPWVHLVLLGVTAATMTLAGSVIEVVGEVSTLKELLDLYRSQPERLLEGFPLAASLLAILGAHEMGHYLACRYYRIPATLPFFIPGPPPFGTFGAVIRIRGIIPDRRALFDVAAAGPLAGYAVALPMLILGLARATPTEGLPGAGFTIGGAPLLMTLVLRDALSVPDSSLAVGQLYLAGWFGMLVTSMNLFPVGQLDGGHVAYALSPIVHRRLARLTLVTMILFVLLHPLLFGILSLYTLWCVILLWLRDRHPRLRDESVTLGPGRRLVAALLLLVFAASFIPIPFLSVS